MHYPSFPFLSTLNANAGSSDFFGLEVPSIHSCLSATDQGPKPVSLAQIHDSYSSRSRSWSADIHPLSNQISNPNPYFKSRLPRVLPKHKACDAKDG